MIWRGSFVILLVLESISSRTVERHLLMSDSAASSSPRAYSKCGVVPESLIGPSTTTSPYIRKRVVGGNMTTTELFPWTVMIKKYGHSDVRCGGSILSNRLVLTAAHCFDQLNKNEMYMLTGVGDMDGLNFYQKMYHASDVIIHEQYNRQTKENDIALLKTSTNISFSRHARPICLPNTTSSLPVGEMCAFAGYGDTQGFPPGRDRKLNCMKVPLVNDSVCAQSDWLGKDFEDVSHVSLCAGYADGGTDACSGDSGGALVCKHSSEEKYYAYGISSWGKGCGERQKPGVYTRVVKFVNWIKLKASSM